MIHFYENTHVNVDEANRFSIEGFDLVCYNLHPKHGRAMYVRSNITEAAHIESTTYCDVIRVGGFHIVNVYKPPSERWNSVHPIPVTPTPLSWLVTSTATTLTGATRNQTWMVTSCKTGHHVMTSISSTTQNSEAHSTPQDGSMTTHQTSAGSP